MKKECTGRLCLFLALCLVLPLIFLGCGSDPVGYAKQHKDLTLILPADFIELDNAEGADFLYGRHSLVFKGLSESKESLQEMTLAQYTESVIAANQKDATPQQSGAGFVFTYEADIGGSLYSYTVATYETQENFWILQFYCPKDTLAENQPEIDVILGGIQPN